MRITQQAIDVLKRNNRLKAHISLAHNCTIYTIDRWIRTRDYKHLTGVVAVYVELFQKESGLALYQIFEPDSASS